VRFEYSVFVEYVWNFIVFAFVLVVMSMSVLCRCSWVSMI